MTRKFLLCLLGVGCGARPNPGLTCSDAVNLGVVAVGSQGRQELTFSNASGSPVQITSTAPATDPEFALGVQAGQAIPAHGGLTAAATFKPFGDGPRSATVSFATDSPLCPTVTVSMSGVGTYLKLSVDPTIVDFGQVVVHSSPVRTITVTNSSMLSVDVTPGAVAGPNVSLFSVDQTAPFSIAPNSSTTIHVTYSPLAPSIEDTAFLILVLAQGAPIQIDLKGEALQSGLKIAPNPLNFGFINTGTSGSLPITLTNVGNENITVSSVVVVNPGSPAAFSIGNGAWTGGTLGPGEEMTVSVVFAPPMLGVYQGEVDIASTDSNNVVPVVLRGVSGDAVLRCTPRALLFGTVAVNIGATLPMICDFSSMVDPNHLEAGLVIENLQTDSPLFTAQLDPASPPQPLATGQSLQIDVTYLPTASETDTGTLQIFSNSNVSTPLLVNLSGNAVAEPPCNYTVLPAEVSLNAAQPGMSVAGGFVIRNVGPNDCLLTGLDLGAGSANVFALTSGGATSQWLSAPGTTPPGAYPTSWPVNVSFTPTLPGTYTGRVQFTISDPSAPHQTVDLLGVVDGGAIQIDMFSGADYDLVLSAEPTPSTLQVFLDGPPPDATPAGQSSGAQLPPTNPDGSANWTYQAASNSVLISATIPLQSSDSLYVEYELAGP